jgi:hypothetical protein
VLTRGPTARLSTPTAWFLMDWRKDYDENSKKGGKWIDKISSVVYGLRTQPSKATGQSPFFLVYGSEAILPPHLMWKSPWLEMFEEGKANTARHLELDSAEEIRCNVLF